MVTEEVSLYIHIPFCRKKCAYCHFYVIPDQPDYQQALYHALLDEWNLYRPLFQDKKLVSVYFGGGTPILWHPSYIAGLLEQIGIDTSLEITIEANPEEITPDLTRTLIALGINRFSVGIQSHDDGLLQLLGRQHGGNKALSSVRTLAEAGATNISVDAMYDIPDQRLDHWKKTIQEIAELPITHVSLYNLTIEPQTVFFKKREALASRLPAPEESVSMFQYAQQTLKDKGFTQYEISAFAKPGYRSIHNSGYWTGRPFIGLGPSAFSFWEGKRFRNIPHLEKYCQSLKQGKVPIDFEEKLEQEAALREYIAVRLRLLEGFSLPENIPTSLKKDIQTVVANGWLRQEGNHIQLTEEGILFYDSLATELV